MAFKREKKVKGHVYHYLVQNRRQDGRVRQDIIQYFGRADESPVHKAYREDVGPVTPIIAEELARAERRWPDWIMVAIREAVVYHKLSLAYILGVLEAWQERGGPERQEHYSGDERPATRAAGRTVIGDQPPTSLILKSTFKTYGTQALISHFVICGYTWSQWSHLNPRVFHSLVIGLPGVDEKLQYCGTVGGGLRASGRREALCGVLKGIEMEKSPFLDWDKVEIIFKRDHSGRQITWVQPKLVAQVKFGQFTRRCRLTTPMFQGLRRDLTPEDLRGVLEKLRAVGVGGKHYETV